MPTKLPRHRTHPPPSPLEQFFSGLRDIVLDTVEDVAYDLRDALVEQGQRVGQGTKPPKDATPRPEKRSRKNRDTNTAPVKASTYYAVLGISPDCPQEVVQAAYRALSRIYHPDVPKTGNTAKMQRIVSAYQVVGDVEKRKEYDRGLKL